jgi:hypothetical protein
MRREISTIVLILAGVVAGCQLAPTGGAARRHATSTQPAAGTAGETAADVGGVILQTAGGVVGAVNPLAGQALAGAGGLLIALAADLRRRRQLKAARAPRQKWTEAQRAEARRRQLAGLVGVDTSKTPAAHAPATSPAVTPAATNALPRAAA